MDWTERIGRRLKPRDLHVFLAVAESGSLAKAAEMLACSRPVVSRTIAELEATLAVPLLDRTPHGIELTRYGRALRARSVAVFDELRKSVKEIEFLADPGSGELRLGCPDPLMAGVAATAIQRLAGRFPKLTIRTELGTHDAQIHFLRGRKCEVALTRKPPTPDESDMSYEVLFYERLLVVAGAGSPWVGRKRVSLNDLADAQWILTVQEAEPGAPPYEGFRAAGVAMPPVNIFSYSLSLRYALLVGGRFVTVIPASTLHFSPMRQLLAILPIKLPAWQRPTVVMTLKDRTLSPAAQEFVACLRDISKPMRQAGQ